MLVGIMQLNRKLTRVGTWETEKGKRIRWVPYEKLKGIERCKLVSFEIDKNYSDTYIKGLVDWCRLQRDNFQSAEYGISRIIEKDGWKYCQPMFRFWLKRPAIPTKYKHNLVYR